jgi:hypothetical protein
VHDHPDPGSLMSRHALRVLVAIALLVPAIGTGACGDDTKQQSTVQQAQGQARPSATPAEVRARARSVARARRRAKARRRAEARQRRRQVRAQRKALAHSKPENDPGDDCADGYDPCVPPYPPDVDCRDLSGPYNVTGSDPHKLDPDGNGKAC